MEEGIVCLRCERSDQNVPILKIVFRGDEVAICTSCLPVLIHKPQLLMGRLEGAEAIEPSDHDHK